MIFSHLQKCYSMLQELSNQAEHSLAECTLQLLSCANYTFTPGSIRSSYQTCAGGTFSSKAGMVQACSNAQLHRQQPKHNITHPTIKVYISAIRNLHVASRQHQHFANQLTPRLEQVLHGIKREQAYSLPAKVRLPITTQIMQQIKQLLLKCPHSYSNILTWVLCCTAIFGFSEFTVPQEHKYDPTVHLSYKDVPIDCSRDPQIIQIHIKLSNCSQAAANIRAITYYFTAKSFIHITGIVLGEKACHSMASLSMAYKTFCSNLRTDRTS